MLIGGPERRPIVIADYDPQWALRFGRECNRIVQALGASAQRVEHVGSTAVPGLAAKPIVDIVVVVSDFDDEPSYRRPLEQAGYVLRVREHGHRMFRTPELDVHVHIWAEEGELRRHLLFRDWLRVDRADRVTYQVLKRELSNLQWDDMNQYADAKGPLIEEITRRAEEWAKATGWTSRAIVAPSSRNEGPTA